MASIAQFDVWKKSGGATVGTVLQVVQVPFTSYATTTSTSFVDTGHEATITPSSTTSKILVIASGSAGASAGAAAMFSITRNDTLIWLNGSSYHPSAYTTGSASFVYLDTPKTTSSLTYKLRIASQTGPQVQWNVDYSNFSGEISTLTLMEIQA